MLQGLALGGEYGGAAVFVAEHVPDNQRGFYTSFIQITATLGLFVSLAVIVATQQSMSPATFQAWGWRLPFLLSMVLVTISLYIRLKMKESPIYAQIKAAGMSSAKPLTEAFTKWPNLKQVLISLLGATMGQGVVWYTGQFYALFYLQTVLKVNPKTANIIVAVALLASMPFFTVFGALTDRIGRKKLMMTALLLSVFSYIPIYKGMQQAAGNNVVTVSSVKDKVTGAIKLTPLTPGSRNRQAGTGEGGRERQPAAADAAGVDSGDLRLHDLRADRRLPGGGLSRQGALYLGFAAVSHRQRRVWRTAAADWAGVLRLDGQYLRRALLSHGGGRYHLPVGIFLLKETHGTLIWDEVGAPR